MRSFGMTPVFPGFPGFVPGALLRRHPHVKAKRSSNWCQFPDAYCCVWLLDSSDPLFQKIGSRFVERLRQLFGSDSTGFYSVDVFNEMTPSQSDPDYLMRTSKAVYRSLSDGDPSAVWIMQGWLFYSDRRFWQPSQIEAVLSGVPKGKLVLLDLYAERYPQWKRTTAFKGRPFVWCTLHNFGGNVEMHGAMDAIAQGMNEAMEADVNIVGTGMCPEALEQNPIVYELASEVAYHPKPPLLDDWFRSYALRRYAGRSCEAAQKAWMLLRDSVYRNTSRRPETMMDIPVSRPGLDSKEVFWGLKPHLWYDPKMVAAAWDALMQCSGVLGDLSSYRYDLVDVGRQVLSKLAGSYWEAMRGAYAEGNVQSFQETGDRLMELLDGLDDLLSTHQGFLLGPVLQEAANWGRDDAEKGFMVQNLKRQLTIWGTSNDGNTELSDYANKQWSGLVRSFYKERWRMWIDRCLEDLKLRREYDAGAFVEEVVAFTEEWIVQDHSEAFAVSPVGSSVAVTRRLYSRYGDEV